MVTDRLQTALWHNANQIRLISSHGARPFYERLGYHAQGEAVRGYGVLAPTPAINPPANAYLNIQYISCKLA